MTIHRKPIIKKEPIDILKFGKKLKSSNDSDDMWHLAYEAMGKNINDDSAIPAFEGLYNYLRWGTHAFTAGKIPLLWTSEELIPKKGILYSYDIDDPKNGIEINHHQQHIVIVPCSKRNKFNKGWEHIVLLNADDEYGFGVLRSTDGFTATNGTTDASGMPLVSFNLLTRFVVWDKNREISVFEVPSENDIFEMMQLVGSGKLRLVDYSVDETKPFTDKDNALYNKLREDNTSKTSHECLAMMPIRYKGFSAIDNYDPKWHKSGTCVFFDRSTKTTYLIGQDEGTYFGCELDTNPKTIEEAYLALQPEVVRQFKRFDNRTIQRQGEWFMVPVKEEEVPTLLDLMFSVRGTQSRVTADIHLPVDDVNSNTHLINLSDGTIIKGGKDGQLYAYNPTLEHEEHEAVEGFGWHTFYRNTAVRSLSENGVD